VSVPGFADVARKCLVRKLRLLISKPLFEIANALMAFIACQNHRYMHLGTKKSVFDFSRPSALHACRVGFRISSGSSGCVGFRISSGSVKQSRSAFGQIATARIVRTNDITLSRGLLHLVGGFDDGGRDL